MTPDNENTYVRPGGGRQCKTCNRKRAYARFLAKREATHAR